ncbi:GAP family protein [Streptomyces sp.]|uniref:GAP family protein n=1 Tax=Streptomyces sp. TaxID=1931 RepID=UPI002D789F35|nr:GAP family protein [Streptomyces sp.]HET6355508.1 GAP family protein [Streptomyces sp.]
MVLDLLLIALAITLDPLPIMAFVLVVSSTRGVWKGLVFILAWLACLVAVMALVLTLTGGEPPSPRSAPSTAGIAVKLAIGVALVLYGERRRRRLRSGRPSDSYRSKSSASVTSRMDRSSIWAAAGLAVFLQPWGMVAAGATTVLEADLSHSSSFLALFGFAILATASLLTAELYVVFAPEAAQARLMKLRAWMQGHQEQAIVVICILLGLWLTGNSIYQLTS